MDRRVVVVDLEEGQDDLVEGMIDVLTSLCARLYGRRSARYRVENRYAGIPV
jgi:putative resolvase